MTVRLSKDQRNQVFGVLKAGSTVNDIAHHFGCSRQTIHYLLNLYNRTGYVRVRARPGRARVTTLRSYRVNTLTHPRNRFKRQQLLLVFTGFMHIRLLVISWKITDLAFSSITIQGLTQHVNNHTIPSLNNVNPLPWPASSTVMNPIEHVYDELGPMVRSNHQMDALNDPNMHLC